MSAAPFLTTTAPTPEAMSDLAAQFAAALTPGDVLLLDGPIGAGKTHFARALIQTVMQEAGQIEDVPSPTFTLVQTYDLPKAEIWHADLYRLTDPIEVIELGLQEAFETAICLVEWPDRLADLAPSGALYLRFAPQADGDARVVSFQSDDAAWADRLAQFKGLK